MPRTRIDEYVDSKRVETTTEEVKVETKSYKRPARKKLHSDGRLKTPQIPGFVLRWINTDSEVHGGRLQNYIDNWWEPVKYRELYGDSHPTPDAIVKCPGDKFEPLLIKLPVELYEQDMAEFHAKNMEPVTGVKASLGKGFYGSVSTG